LRRGFQAVFAEAGVGVTTFGEFPPDRDEPRRGAGVFGGVLSGLGAGDDAAGQPGAESQGIAISRAWVTPMT
jgi:hypothetical protein